MLQWSKFRPQSEPAPGASPELGSNPFLNCSFVITPIIFLACLLGRKYGFQSFIWVILSLWCFIYSSVFHSSNDCLIVSGYCGESTKSQSWRFGQKEILGSLRLDRWPILFPYPKKNTLKTRRCTLFLCQQHNSPNQFNNGIIVSGNTVLQVGLRNKCGY